MNIVEVTSKEVNGTKSIMLIDDHSNKWINLEPIGELCGYKNPAKSISALYNRYKDQFLTNSLFHQIGEIHKPRLFFNREGVIRLKMLSRKFRNSKALDELIAFLSQVDSGELKVIHPDDVEKLKQGLIPQGVTHQLTTILEDLKELKTELKVTPQQKWIIHKLISLYGVTFGFSSISVWNEFSAALAITGYKDARRLMFRHFVDWFFEKDPKTVARILNIYMKKRYQDSEIVDTLLDILEGKNKALTTLKDFPNEEKRVA